MYDCNLIKSRAMKMQENQIPYLQIPAPGMPSTPTPMPTPTSPIPPIPAMPMPSLPTLPARPMPFTPTTPSVPIIPKIPTIPTTPETPTIPIPRPPTVPRAPAMPMPMPGTPTTPTVPRPTTPAQPTVPRPTIPTTPAQPVFPTLPPEQPQQEAPPLSPLLPRVLPPSPNISVPANPLLPPEFAEILNYESLQYLNGYLRTQIGEYIEVEFLIGTSNRVIVYGILRGVGLNYILLEDPIARTILACDFYNIKFVKILPHLSAQFQSHSAPIS